MLDGLNTNNKNDFSEYRQIFFEYLCELDEAAELNLSDEIIEKNLKIIELCYNYNGDIHGINNYLKEKGYLIVLNTANTGNFTDQLFDNIEEIKAGKIFIGYFFKNSGVPLENKSRPSIDRFLFVTKPTKVPMLISKIKEKLYSIPFIQEY